MRTRIESTTLAARLEPLQKLVEGFHVAELNIYPYTCYTILVYDNFQVSVQIYITSNPKPL